MPSIEVMTTPSGAGGENVPSDPWAQRPVGFSVNADAGATYTAGQVVTAMADVQPGGISIAHMHRPRSGTAPGMESALPKMLAAGYEFVHLP